MKTTQRGLLVGFLLATLTGCAGESASTSPETASSPPGIVAPTDAGNPPVTLSGYVDTSATGQVK